MCCARSIRLAGVAGLALGGTWLPGAELPNPAPAQAAAASRKAEFKLLVPAADTARALSALKLNPQRAVTAIVCYFDTSDGALDAKHLILRARQQGAANGESTVKLRAAEGLTALGDAERAIPSEQDWVDETGATFSRSLDNGSLAKDLVSKVAAGQVPVVELFTAAQRQLITARVPDLKWEQLHCFGPLRAEIWRQQAQLPGFPSAVTVELWHLQKPDQKLDLLEISAKAKPKSPAQAQALAKQFYAAAKTAGLGDPSGQTKTRMVLDFFQPPVRDQ